MNDTSDRYDDALPVRRSTVPPMSSSPRLEPGDEAYGTNFANDPAAASGKGFSLGTIWHGFRRYWWQSTLIWLIGTAALVALAYYNIKPSYDAMAAIRIEDGDAPIVNPNGNARTIDFDQYMLTQVTIVTSPPVIETALALHPELKNTPLLKDSLDPIRDIAGALRVGQRRGTNLIEVQMSSRVMGEAAEVVNAVVEAYLSMATLTRNDSNQLQIEELKQLRSEDEKKVEAKRLIVQKLQENSDTAEKGALKNAEVALWDEIRAIRIALNAVQLQKIADKARLEGLRAELGHSQPAADPAEIRARVTKEFYRDPNVADIQVQIERLDAKLKKNDRVSQNPNDPSLRITREDIQVLKKKRDALWAELEPEITQRLSVPQTDFEIENEIKISERKFEALCKQEEELKESLKKAQVENKKDVSEGMKLEWATRELEMDQRSLENDVETLNNLERNARSKIARIKILYKASASIRPDSNRRVQAMAAAPVGMFLLVLMMISLLEMRGARVSNPDELVSRINLQVIGIVPPLPKVGHLASMTNGNGNGHANGEANGDGSGNGEIMSASEFRARRQLDAFVQSLDHLRVALCNRPDRWGRDRHCVLITSACGSEGKTTLAAQLAERCVNAGLLTLLIDADLRNPTLSRMLDSTDNPGLINVLRGEVLAEDVVTVIGDAGGFHLLPAGYPKMDPSRLLQSERLASLIAQARETFDMIIVDAPPVLPVPDALTIGRCTDGAVLAVRYDASRFPLVEKAYRRLNQVGVPVIGAVVNGVKSMESAYGYGGYYAYGATSEKPTGHGS